MYATITFGIYHSPITTDCILIPFAVFILFFSNVVVLRFLQLCQSCIPAYVEYINVQEVDSSVIEPAKQELKVLSSNCSYTTHADDDEEISIVVKKVRRHAPSRRRQHCEADYAPEFDCWGTPKKRRKGRDYIGYASVWYILSLVVRRKMKL